VKPALWASLIVLLPCGVARASGGPDAYGDIDAAAAVDVHGLVDGYWLHNFDEPASKTNQLRAFDFDTGFRLGYLRLTLARRPGRVGFRVDAGFGNTADVFYHQDPAAARHPHVARAYSYFGQAFFTAVVPLERPLQIDVGKFGTPVGLEDNETLSNWNYSRSLLYTWAEPSLHTGARATWSAAGALDLALFWVNGWDSGVLDGSGMRTFAVAATWRPAAWIDVALVDMAGLEHPPTNLSAPLALLNVADASVVARATERLSFASSADYGNGRAEGGVSFWGIAAYARVQALPWLAGALRGEYFSDPDGFATGTAQRLAEGTATVELRKDVSRLRLVGRLEYRHDRSSDRPFDGALPATRSAQDTITVGTLVAY
jgi:hypothetical protein